MFDSLDEQVKADAKRSSSNRERMLRWSLVALASILVFGGIYAGVHFIQ